MSKSTPEKSSEYLLTEVTSRLQLLESGRPSRLDAMAVSSISKLPFKALLYREALIWRITELGRSAVASFEKNKLASAILLTRATVETSAALRYLWTKLDAAVKSGAVGDLDEYLMKLSMGSRTDLDIMPQAISVLTFVDRVEKDVAGFRQQYDHLSEFAHPNWAGTTLLYSKSDSMTLSTEFGANIRASDSTKQIGISNLSVALAMFETSYNLISDLMSAFVALCEHRLTSGGSAGTTP